MIVTAKLYCNEMKDSHCCIAEHIRWVVQVDAIHIIDTRSGGHCRLPYPQAAVWDMLSRNYAREKIVYLLMPIAGLDEERAWGLVNDTLADWYSDGLIKKRMHRG